MNDIRKITVEETKQFQKQLSKLTPKERETVNNQIYKLVEAGRLNPRLNTLYRVHKINLESKLKSSLYVYRIDHQLRLLLLYENDPLFEQYTFTLLRVVRHDKLEEAFKSVVESLYNQPNINLEDELGND